jgi:hypothetical protein
MSNRFIHDPREAVKVGDVVQVKVISVEPETKRIGLSMKALLPSAQRRRKKQPRRAAKPAAPVRAAEAVPTGEAAGTDAPASPVPFEKPAHPERPRWARPHEGPPHFRRRGPRNPERPREPEEQNDSVHKMPEPSLQEKIAILQSKFRRIN